MTAIEPLDVLIGGAYSYIEQISTLGVHKQYIYIVDDLGRELVINGITCDNQGNAYFAGGVPGGSVYEPHDIVWCPDNSGLIVIIAVDDDTVILRKYAMDATTVLHETPPINTDTGFSAETDRLKVDVACDSKTVYYTDQGLTVFSYNINTDTQLTNWDQLDPSSNYRYNAFKLLQNTSPQQIISLMTRDGNGPGPQRAICLGGSLVHWSDEIDPITVYHIYKRLNSDDSDVLSHVVSLDPDDTNDEVWSLGCFYNPCGGVGAFVTLIGAN